MMSKNTHNRLSAHGSRVVTLAIRTMMALTLVVAGMPALVGSASAGEPAKKLSAQAIQECQLGRHVKDRAAKLVHFERAEELAKQAINMNEEYPDGHFAMFCSLGEQLRLDGESLSSYFGLRRVLAELDRTLELDSDHLDALSAKGTLLIRLPGWLGGDRKEGEQMLRRVVREDARAINALLVLAETCAERGERGEAVRLATHALNIAESDQKGDMVPVARATLAQLDAADGDLLVVRK